MALFIYVLLCATSKATFVHSYKLVLGIVEAFVFVINY